MEQLQREDEVFRQYVISDPSISKSIVDSCELIRRFLSLKLTSSHLHHTQSLDARREFYLLFPKLMDRIFGVDGVVENGWIGYHSSRRMMMSNNNNGTSSSRSNFGRRPSGTERLLSAITSASASVLHSSSSSSIKPGQGPLSDLSKSRKPSLDGNENKDPHAASNTLNQMNPTDAMVSLLSTHESMFHLLFQMEHPVELKLELKLLPLPSQLALTSQYHPHSQQQPPQPPQAQALPSLYPSSSNDPAQYYSGSGYHHHHHHHSPAQQQTLSFNYPQPPSGVAPPALYVQLLSRPLTQQFIDPRSPYLMVSIAEYYLIYFLRYPLTRSGSSGSRTTSNNNPNSGRSSSSSVSNHKLSSNSSSSTCAWMDVCRHGRDYSILMKDDAYLTLLGQYVQTFLPPQEQQYGSINPRQGELFLHLVVELWLGQNHVLYGDTAVSSNRPSTSGPRSSSQRFNQVRKLPQASTPVYTMGEYIAPTPYVLRSMLLLVCYVVSDIVPTTLLPNSSVSISSPLYHQPDPVSTLSPHLTFLQRPMFQFFKVVIARCQMEVSSAVFCSMMEIWLAWTQPWLASSSSSSSSRNDAETQSDDPQSDDPQFSSAWTPYVLMNFHFYTTVFHALIERMHRVDFEYSPHALDLVEQILMLYRPEFLDILEQRLLSSSSSTSRFSEEDQARWIQQHCLTLGVAVVEPRDWTMLHARSSAERLQERLHWLMTKSSGSSDRRRRSTSGPASSRENQGGPVDHDDRLVSSQCRRINVLLETIFQLPSRPANAAPSSHQNHHLRSSSRAGAGRLSNQRDSSRILTSPDRLSRVALSPLGIKQLKTGQRLCNPQDVVYIGDLMWQPIRSYEIPLLVHITLYISETLNVLLGLNAANRLLHRNRQREFHQRTKLGTLSLLTEVDPRGWRFNFRCFASVRFLAVFWSSVLVLSLVVMTGVWLCS